MIEPEGHCAVCGSTDGVRRYAVTVEGEALHLAPDLCTDHGTRLLLRFGSVIATLDRPMEDIFRSGGKERI